MVVLVVFLLFQQSTPMAKMVVLVVVLLIIVAVTILILVAQEQEHHGQEHQETIPDQDGVVMVATQLRHLLLMEVAEAVVPKMDQLETELPLEMVVVDIKFPLHIKIQTQLSDMLDLVVQTSGLPVAAEVEPMTAVLVVRAQVVPVPT